MAADPLTASADSREPRQDAYYWRFLATALSFAAFGLGAALVGLVLLPIVRLLPALHERKRVRARAVVQGALRLFLMLMHRGGGLSYRFSGRERLGRSGQLIVANHPSLIDVVFLLAYVPAAGCVVKHGLWRNPLTRAVLQLAEYIPNEPTFVMIEAASDALRAGQTLIMFPEGTRTRCAEEPVFHRGAASVALRAATVLTPVYISVEPTTLTKAEPWYRIPARRPRFTIEVGADWDLRAYRDLPPPLASRTLNTALEQGFKAHLGAPRVPRVG